MSTCTAYTENLVGDEASCPLPHAHAGDHQWVTPEQAAQTEVRPIADRVIEQPVTRDKYGRRYVAVIGIWDDPENPRFAIDRHEVIVTTLPKGAQHRYMVTDRGTAEIGAGVTYAPNRSVAIARAEVLAAQPNLRGRS